MADAATERQNSPRISSVTLILWAVIVGLAAVLRLTALDTVPPGGDADAAWIGLDALDWLDKGVWPHYINAMYAPEPLHAYLIGLAVPLVGIANMTPRLVTGLAGVLTVALLFPATWWLLGDEKNHTLRERAALLATLSGAVSLHAMHVSRLGIRAPHLPVAILLTVWLAAWAWHKESPNTPGFPQQAEKSFEPQRARRFYDYFSVFAVFIRDQFGGRGYWRWVLAGVALALTQYIYISGRMMALVAILWVGHTLWADRSRFKQQWRGWLVMAFVAALLVLPNLYLFATAPEAFTGRADVATGQTGGLIWDYDLSAFGGLGGLLAQKLGNDLLAVGITWEGPYKGMGFPILAPLFLGGLLLVIIPALRNVRRLVYGWPLLAIPVLLLPDLISGTITTPHPLRQIGLLPFLFILSGLGLARAWTWLERRITTAAGRQAISMAGMLLAILPSLWGFNVYMEVYTPQVYADPATAWHLEQADVDLSRRILADPDAAYLLPYDEYTRWNIPWLTAAAFRDRHSAINSEGLLDIPNPPPEITVIQAADPFRVRHDGQVTVNDPALWVLLYDGQTLLLPPLTAEQSATVQDHITTAERDTLLDLSESPVADFFTIATPDGLFDSRPVIDHPLDATLRLPADGSRPEVALVGYTLPDVNLPAGATIPVTLFWRALAANPGENAEIFVQLWNDAGDNLAGWHGLPYNGVFRTRSWGTRSAGSGEIVATHHHLTLPDDLPVGRYTLAAGLFRLLHNEPFTVEGANAGPDGRIVLAPDLRVAPPPVEETLPQPPATIVLGDLLNVAGLGITVAGESVSAAENWNATPGQAVTVDITWQPLARPPVDYSAFLHLSPAEDQPPLAQADVALGDSPNGERLPSGVWLPGDAITDRLTLVLPDDLPPGTYDLLLGVYYWQTGERLAITVDGESIGDRVSLGRILVE